MPDITGLQRKFIAYFTKKKFINFGDSKKSYIFVVRKMILHKNNINSQRKMTKAEIVNEIAKKTGIEKSVVLTTVESFMDVVKHH